MAPLGLLAYGGPMAHIAMLDSLFVEQLKWLKPSQFTELFALCQSLPGNIHFEYENIIIINDYIIIIYIIRTHIYLIGNCDWNIDNIFC